MIILSDIRDWIKEFGIGENFYIGKLDNKKDKSIGVYERNEYQDPDIAIGGLETTKTIMQPVSILIHWNASFKETEGAARTLYNRLLCIRDATINETHIDYIHLRTPKPIDVGTDAKGVYERVIWLDIYYQKEEE